MTKRFCGWYQIFEQVFKPFGDLLNISDCYYRSSFMIYGGFFLYGKQDTLPG